MSALLLVIVLSVLLLLLLLLLFTGIEFPPVAVVLTLVTDKNKST